MNEYNERRNEEQPEVADSTPVTPEGGFAAAPPPPPTGMPGTIALVKEGFRRIEAKLGPLLISLVIGLIAAVPLMFAAAPFQTEGAIFTATSSDWILFGAAILWALVLGFFNNVAVIYLFANQAQPIAYLEAFSWAVRNVVPMAWIGILTSLIMMAAAAAFIIPALILSVYLLFSSIVYMREGQRGTKALLRSTDLVYGAFWPIVVRLILVFLLLFAAGLVLGAIFGVATAVLGETGEALGELLNTVVQLAVGWLGITILVQLYDHRYNMKPQFDPSSYPRVSLLYKVMAAIGLVLPILVGIIVAMTLPALISNMNNAPSGMSNEEFEVFMEQLEEAAREAEQQRDASSEALQRYEAELEEIQRN